MADENTQDMGELNSFSQFIAQVDEGGLHHDLSVEVENIVAALNDAKHAGAKSPGAKLAINLAFKLDGQVIEVVGDFKTTLPKMKREKSVFWATARNRLTRNNPKQQRLPFRDITTSQNEEIRAV